RSEMLTEGQHKEAPRLITFHSADGRTEKVQVELLPVIEKVCVIPNPVDQRSSIRTPLAGNDSRRHKQAIPDHPKFPGGSAVQRLVRFFDALEMPCAVLSGSDQILLGKEPPGGAFGTIKVIRCDLLCVLAGRAGHDPVAVRARADSGALTARALQHLTLNRQFVDRMA